MSTKIFVPNPEHTHYATNIVLEFDKDTMLQAREDEQFRNALIGQQVVRMTKILDEALYRFAPATPAPKVEEATVVELPTPQIVDPNGVVVSSKEFKQEENQGA